ncbi:hypothetical protein RND71_007407 [Anisodus tanguticus]|uniref:Uncharacterized protein n=1 Tax=Anisodus tanguticus TaxID=243964 RepID=A0AAE1VJ44_9SOLA|nr:hypothetical protein RND71_007407 [Anisodus tanguticus]
MDLQAHVKPLGTFFPQEFRTKLMAMGTLSLRAPKTLALIAVHKHKAASTFAIPSNRAQHWLLGFAPMTS